MKVSMSKNENVNVVKICSKLKCYEYPFKLLHDVFLCEQTELISFKTQSTMEHTMQQSK